MAAVVVVLAVALVWLYVDTRGQLGRIDKLSDRLWHAEQTIALLTERATRGEDE